MDINYLQRPDVRHFIEKNKNAPVSTLALKKNPFPNFDYKELINQIECSQKSKTKLPTWFKFTNCIYPSKVSLEQTSSEITAKYKSEIISGQSLIDLTGGFGVDDYYFSKVFKNVTHCELNAELSKIVAHNFKLLGVSNCTFVNGDSIKTLTTLEQDFDWLFIDPSRRNDKKGKVFLLKDCLPDVPYLLNDYFKYSNSILIKTAPILDIKAGLSELKFVKKIHILAVDNDVKEVLWEIEKNFDDKINVITKNFTKNNTEQFDFILGTSPNCDYALPRNYLYEPNSAIMKSGGFNQIGIQFGLKKIHQHSHLYTSNQIIPFPGRIFKINTRIMYTKNEMKTNLENKKSNVSTRNFSETVENIRSKWKIKDGGNDYSFFTTDLNNNKIVLICTKIQLPNEN